MPPAVAAQPLAPIVAKPPPSGTAKPTRMLTVQPILRDTHEDSKRSASDARDGSFASDARAASDERDERAASVAFERYEIAALKRRCSAMGTACNASDSAAELYLRLARRKLLAEKSSPPTVITQTLPTVIEQPSSQLIAQPPPTLVVRSPTPIVAHSLPPIVEERSPQSVAQASPPIVAQLSPAMAAMSLHPHVKQPASSEGDSPLNTLRLPASPLPALPQPATPLLPNLPSLPRIVEDPATMASGECDVVRNAGVLSDLSDACVRVYDRSATVTNTIAPAEPPSANPLTTGPIASSSLASEPLGTNNLTADLSALLATTGGFVASLPSAGLVFSSVAVPPSLAHESRVSAGGIERITITRAVGQCACLGVAVDDDGFVCAIDMHGPVAARGMAVGDRVMGTQHDEFGLRVDIFVVRASNSLSTASLSIDTLPTDTPPTVTPPTDTSPTDALPTVIPPAAMLPSAHALPSPPVPPDISVVAPQTIAVAAASNSSLHSEPKPPDIFTPLTDATPTGLFVAATPALSSESKPPDIAAIAVSFVRFACWLVVFPADLTGG